MEENKVSVLGGLLGPNHITFENSCYFIPTNARARRLGAMIFLLGKIYQGKKIEGILTNLSVAEIGLLKENFQKEGITNGELTAKGPSTRHYLNLCRKFSFANKQSSLFSLTNSGRLLCNLIKERFHQPYPLAQSTRNLFFLLILKADFLGQKALAQLFISGKRILQEIKRDFFSSLKKVFSETSNYVKEAQISGLLRDRLLSFESWKKPEIYSDHLVTPRVYWLSDLGLLTISGKKELEISLNQAQENFFRRLSETPYLKEAQLYDLAFSHFSLFQGRDSFILENLENPELEVEKALEEIFSILTPPANLQKIRADIVGTFLLILKIPLLEKLRKLELSVPSVIGKITCPSWKYQIHLAARPTQSYVIRFPK